MCHRRGSKDYGGSGSPDWGNDSDDGYSFSLAGSGDREGDSERLVLRELSRETPE